MTMFAPIYYSYLALIDSYMHIYFLNRVGLFFGTNFESQDDLNFGTEGVLTILATLCASAEHISPRSKEHLWLTVWLF